MPHIDTINSLHMHHVYKPCNNIDEGNKRKGHTLYTNILYNLLLQYYHDSLSNLGFKEYYCIFIR